MHLIAIGGSDPEGRKVLTGTTVRRVSRAAPGEPGRLHVEATGTDGTAVTRHADMVLVVVGVRPDTGLAVDAGAALGFRVPSRSTGRCGPACPTSSLAAGSSATPTCHSALPRTKQGRVAGETALGGNRQFAGSLGTQVVKITDQAAARTGLRHSEAAAAGFGPITIGSEADDHKAYYPGSQRIAMRFTGDRATGRLLGSTEGRIQMRPHRPRAQDRLAACEAS